MSTVLLFFFYRGLQSHLGYLVQNTLTTHHEANMELAIMSGFFVMFIKDASTRSSAGFR